MENVSSLAILLFVLLVEAAVNVEERENMFLVGLDKPLKECPLPRLPFPFSAMEPLIDAKTMKMHYSIVLKNHTIDLNSLLRKWRASVGPQVLSQSSLINLRRNEADETLPQSSLINMWRNEEKIPHEFKEEFYRHSGGYVNHLLYFATMSPPRTNEGKKFSKEFARIVNRSFTSITNMKNKMIELAEEKISGSGWVFLVRAGGYKDGDHLTVMVTRDEISPLNNPRISPVLAFDMWEHSYLIKYGLNRRDYFDNWWQTIDWSKVEQIFNWWREVEGYTEK